MGRAKVVRKGVVRVRQERGQYTFEGSMDATRSRGRTRVEVREREVTMQRTLDGEWEPAETKRNPWTVEREAADEKAGKVAK